MYTYAPFLSPVRCVFGLLASCMGAQSNFFYRVLPYDKQGWICFCLDETNNACVVNHIVNEWPATTIEGTLSEHALENKPLLGQLCPLSRSKWSWSIFIRFLFAARSTDGKRRDLRKRPTTPVCGLNLKPLPRYVMWMTRRIKKRPSYSLLKCGQNRSLFRVGQFIADGQPTLFFLTLQAPRSIGIIPRICQTSWCCELRIGASVTQSVEGFPKFLIYLFF